MSPLLAVLGGSVIVLLAGLFRGRRLQRTLPASLAVASLLAAIGLLWIPLYLLSGGRVREEASLEAGLKYLIVGSLGSATLLFGLALLYGATASTDLSRIASSIGSTVPLTDPLLLTGIALAATG